MKIFYTIVLIVIVLANAQAFEGCGEYLVKGILRKNRQDNFRVSYIIFEGSNSQMTMEILVQEDFLKIYSSLDKPTSMKVKILNPLDGTKGKIRDVIDIKPRVPNPLSATDQGLEKINSLNCL